MRSPLRLAWLARRKNLDAELPSALVQFVGAHLELKNTLESAKEQMAAAAQGRKGGGPFEGGTEDCAGPDRASGG